MKLNLIMITIVALCVDACASNDVRPDVASGQPTHVSPGEYRERSGSSSREGDTIHVTDEQVIIYVPEYWNGNPRLEPRYVGRIQGNRVLIPITGQDGDPSGPDWQPSPTFTASFEILQTSQSKLVLRPLDSNLKIGGNAITFEKD